MRFVYYALFLLLTFATNGESQSQKNVFWTINLDTPQQITISTDDMLRIRSSTFAAVPANLGKAFQITYDRTRLSLIAERPPDSDGQMGKQYFLLAVAPGTSEITITVKDQNKTLTAVTLNVTCQ